MSRISIVEVASANPEQLEARAAIKKAWGRVPNIGEVIALSLPLTRAILDFDDALGAGTFRDDSAELLAIAVSEQNRCAYCLSAHSAAGRAAGVASADVATARTGSVTDPKMTAALTFAQGVVRGRGHVTDDALAAVREAGWSDVDIVEIVGHVIATTLSNYLHHLSNVPIDYPLVTFAHDADQSRER